MKTRRWIATCVVALLGVTAVLAKDIRVVVFKVAQMHCEKCEKKVKDNMRFEKGLKDLSTEVKTKTVTITYDADKTNVKNLQAGFKKFNYEAEFVKETKKDDKKAGLSGSAAECIQKCIAERRICQEDRRVHYQEGSGQAGRYVQDRQGRVRQVLG